MPSSYTSSLRLTLPATGELSGQWGSVVNQGITELLDSAVAGTASISTWGGAGVAYTLSNNSGTADEARKMFIVATGSPGEAKNVICPAVSKFYVFRNDTTGGFALTLKTSGGTGIAVPAGQYKFLYCDGTNVVEMFNSAGALTLSGALSVGGTATFAANPTLSAGTANQVQYLNASKVLTGSANLTFDGTTLTANTASLTNALAASSGGTGQSTYTAGDLIYATGATALAKLGIGASTTVLTSSGTAPQWTAASSVAIGTATNLAGGAAGSVPYQSGAATTTFLSIGAANTVMTSSGTAPQWSTALTGLTGVSTTTLSASSTVSGAGFSTYLASPPAIGGTAANTGAFTTLTTSSTVTLNGGTANGVLYLNGSKVATSGSALTFDGTNLSASLGLKAASAGTVVSSFVDGLSVGGYESIGFLASPGNALAVGGYRAAQWSAVEFYASGSLQATLTSTGLGIGTSSPTQKLEVAGSVLLNPTNPALAFNTLAYQVYKQGTSLRLYANSIDHLVCDGTGNVGIGTSSPTNRLTVAAPNAKQNVVSTTGTNEVILFLQNTGGDFYIGRENSAGTYFSAPAYSANLFSAGAYPMLFWTNSTERMRLDSSGNLGIGTSSPGEKLQVAGAIRATGAVAANTTGGILAYQGSSTVMLGSWGADASTYGAIQFYQANSTGTLNRTGMLLDTSGNLGLGVTPSAWWSGSKAIQIGLGATFEGRTGTNIATVSSNSFINSSGVETYINTAAATKYNQGVSGDHRFYTAPSGTAGNAISFTQAMTLDASGNLGVGTTSPSNRIHAFNTTTTQLQVQMSGQADMRVIADTGYGALSLESNMPLIFRTNSTERARITSGGDFGIGNTNPQYRLTVDKDTTSALAFFTNSNASAPKGLYVDFSAASPNNTTEYFLYCEDSTAQRATIRSNGGLANYSANDVNLSDRREKTNFAPAKSYLDAICAIPVQTFEYIDQSPDDPGLTLGVVAQDVQAVAPELVMESNWGTEDNPKMRLSIYQTDLQYALMKCIQEQQALITALTARVAALEAQP